MKIGKAILGAALAAGAVIAVTAPATAAPRTVPAAVRMVDGPRPGLGDDVYLYHPIIKSLLQPIPLPTLIEFRMEAYTNYMPLVFHMTVHLEWWRSARQLHRAKGAWVEVHPTVTYGISALPAVGQHHYLKPPATWSCVQGRLYIRVHAWGIMHNHKPDSVEAFMPWAGFTTKDLDKGNVHKPPSLKQAWHTYCQGDDTLIG